MRVCGWLCCLLGVILQPAGADDILGCGGFVKSEVEINFSMVEVKLYTKHGSLKYQTDCAPNNGYYMVPVYDKGEYVLKVEPPPGWTFEPSSVELNIDGSTDKCSRGDDINFQFTGFGLVGRVVSTKQKTGPQGVLLSLTKAKSRDVIKTATSTTNGDFSFEKVLPGDYMVTATHPNWEFDINMVDVHVGRETGNAGDILTVLGFDVRGQVFSEGEPVIGVSFVLFSDEKKRDEVIHCDKSPLPGFQLRDGLKEIICFVPSEKDGSFRFPAVPNGKYKLVPYYKGEHVAFDILPSMVEFEVNQDTVIIEKPFTVSGFSVYGKVLNKKGGKGIADVKISVNGQEQGVSNPDGIYHLYSMKTGHYEISATAEHAGFENMKVKITPNTPQLQDLIASRFSICGQIIIDKIPEGLSYTSPQRQVAMHPKGKPADVTTLTTDTHGAFCTEAKQGSYIFKVILTDHEIKAGLKLAPLEREVKVVEESVSGVVFSQFRANIRGSVVCLEKCGSMQVSLSPVVRSDDRQLTSITDGPSGSTFSFSDVMPGNYKVNLLHEDWCWKEKVLDIEVVDRDITNLKFTQSGYILSCSLSHDIRLNFAQENKPGNVGSFSLTKGVNKFCLAQPGVYRLTLDSCHQFEQDLYRYDTSMPSVLTLTAVRHRTEGRILSEEKKTDVFVTITSAGSSETPQVIGPLKAEPLTDSKTHKFVYNFQYWAKNGEKLHVKPSSEILLFYPDTLDVTIDGETCPGVVAKFEAKMGVFLAGKVTPALSGVKVTISNKATKEELVSVDTNAKGEYRVGPLHNNIQYDTAAAKEGYVMSASGKHNFNAFKLAEINVKVYDERQKALAGVLLSLSGGSYRSNKLSSAEGSMSFIGLGPGEYFLRPMMKEYRFEPTSQMITVKEGASISLEVRSTRVAFSCYGKVTSLNGEPEPGIILEAVSIGKDAACHKLQEENKSEQDGTFRIRGLQPNCDYNIQLKNADVNQHIERITPKITVVKATDSDIVDVNVIAFRRMNQLDLSGNVITSPEFLPSIRITLFKESNMDSAIHTISLSATSFFYLPSLSIDNEQYVVRLTSSLSRATYEHQAEELVFVANTSHHHFTFRFEPTVKSADSELSQGSFLILPISILIGLLVYHYQKILPFLLQLVDSIKVFIQKSGANSPTHVITSQPMPDTDFLSENPAAGKKKKIRKT